MASFLFATRKVHRWLSYLLFIQVAFWITGGLAFALIPFDSIIKSGDYVSAPVNPTINSGDLLAVTKQLGSNSQITLEGVHSSSQGPLIEVTTPSGTQWIATKTAQPAVSPSAADITQFARTLYRGQGPVIQARHLDTVEPRYLGLVDELYGRGGVWQVLFDDAVGTRLYFDGTTGIYITARNNFWVFYDAMWRLHIMDYSDGKDFNNPLLRIFTPLAFIFVLSGIALSWSAMRRAARARQIGRQ